MARRRREGDGAGQQPTASTTETGEQKAGRAFAWSQIVATDRAGVEWLQRVLRALPLAAMPDRPLEALLLTNEYPPHVYGGAGVHVEYLARELAKLIRVDVRSFGDQRIGPTATDPAWTSALTGLRVHGYEPTADLANTAQWLSPVLGAFSREIEAAARPDRRRRRALPHLVHAPRRDHGEARLRPAAGRHDALARAAAAVEARAAPGRLRPLGWVERTAIEMADAVIAVSKGTRDDVLAQLQRRPGARPRHPQRHRHGRVPADRRDRPDRALPASTSTRPYVLFVGRITRQKGIVHLVRAISHLPRDTQVVLCAGAPDTPEIAAEMEAAVDAARGDHPDVVWIDEMVDKPTVRQLYSHATVFCCPSIYEPFGIINLEAMACETRGRGQRRRRHPRGGRRRRDRASSCPSSRPAATRSSRAIPDRFERDLASAVQSLLDDPERSAEMGRRGRERAVEHFSWASIAEQTVASLSFTDPLIAPRTAPELPRGVTMCAPQRRPSRRRP